ncbi:MAG: hypothetical protein RJA87_1277 [Pseudomonadota bacterium]
MRLVTGIAVLSLSLSTATLAAEPPALTPSVLSWTPKQQAWGYRHMEDAFPVKVVARGPSVRELPKAAQELNPTWTWQGKPQTITTYMKTMNTSGLLVLQDGKIVLERYGLGRTPQERWTSFSVAKSVTAMLVGAAIADGKIASLNDKVSTYLPGLKGSAYDQVSVRQLISMTSGVKWNEDYQDPNSDVARVGLQTDERGVNPIIAYMRKLPRAHPPGTKFLYNTGETDLTGLLVSTAVGKPLSSYMSEKIWQPYGMEQDAVWMTDQGGHERGGCCLSMTLRDYARFGQFLLEDGVAQGKPMVPERWVELATSYENDFGKDRGYGFFMWLIPGGYAAEGIFGQQIFVFPQDKLVIAVNSAWTSADKEQDWIAQEEMARAVRASLTH